MIELRYGALYSSRRDENLKRLAEFISRCTVLDVSHRTAGIYAEIRLQRRVAATPIPENDVWIAALCVQHGLALATSDDHFARVNG